VLDLSAFVLRQVALPSVPVTATSGIVPSEAFSLTTAPPPVPAIRLRAGTVNIALLGVDTRPIQGGLLTDVIIIASIDPYVPAVTLLSVPRDTLVYVPGYRMERVNTAFARGPEVFRQTMKYNFGLDVHYYAAINFAALVNGVDTLSGIEIVALCPIYHVFPKDPYYLADPAAPLTVTVPYTDTFTGEVWMPGQLVPTLTIAIPQAGVYQLNGLQALAYVRARAGIPGGDVDRTRRAQQIVRALLNRARQKGILTLARLPILYDQFKRHVRTDLTLEQILSLALQADRLGDAAIRSRYLDEVGMTSAVLEPVGAVLIPNRENIAPFLQKALFVPLNQRTGEGIPVEVWNATGRRNFGPVVAERLRELGFRVLSIQDATEVYTQTKVIDFTTTKKGSAIPLLQRALNLRPESVIAQPNPGETRYRIIAGRDFEACYHKTTPANVRQVLRPTPAATPIGATPTPTPAAPAPEGKTEG
jgi:anionic cell wall polymer biosynthesis LytR-Cps2A-Psr (LCP) family protein